MSQEKVWRPEQYVLINLDTGTVSPLLNAPAGRDLGYGLPMQVFWRSQSRVVVTNTFAPQGRTDATSTVKRAKPSIVTVDVRTKAVTRLAEFEPDSNIRGFEWQEATATLQVRYEHPADRPEHSALHQPSCVSWHAPDVRIECLYRTAQRVFPDVLIGVKEDLNRPAELWAHDVKSNRDWLLWNPNPQADSLDLGRAFLYCWRDSRGRLWSGILSLPPQYVPARRYPLVIQTHGYDKSRFFADGYSTTASGGRALSAKGVIVLQAGELLEDDATPRESEDQCDGFISAIDSLARRGLVNRQQVGIIGFSRTAQHVLFALTHYPDAFAAAMVTSPDFSYVPYVMWSAGFGASGPQKEAEGMNGGPPVAAGLQQWFKHAPGFNLEAVRTPLLILAFGKGGLISEWEPLAILRRLGRPVDMVWCWKEDVPHFVLRPKDRYAVQQLAIDWFDFWLNGHKHFRPSRIEQYSRWDALRSMARNSRRSSNGLDRPEQRSP